eukprot:3019402-Rhodomonas_salina.1
MGSVAVSTESVCARGAVWAFDSTVGRARAHVRAETWRKISAERSRMSSMRERYVSIISSTYNARPRSVPIAHSCVWPKRWMLTVARRTRHRRVPYRTEYEDKAGRFRIRMRRSPACARGAGRARHAGACMSGSTPPAHACAHTR